MCVEKAFWIDPYQTEILATITSVQGSVIMVDKTVAYAFSGGQESDNGTINGFHIIKAEKNGRKILYTLPEEHGLHSGDVVLIKIDWKRRYKIMRLHFAAEIILELINQRYNNPPKIGAHIAEDKARVDFSWQGNIATTFEILSKEITRMVDENLVIDSEFCDRENQVRYWEIKNFGRVLCGGTHIKRTGEIGRINLRRNNIGKNKERIEITLL